VLQVQGRGRDTETGFENAKVIFLPFTHSFILSWKHVPEFNSHHRRRAASMCRFVIRTPRPDDKPEVATLVLDLSVIAHCGRGRAASGPGPCQVGWLRDEWGYGRWGKRKLVEERSQEGFLSHKERGSRRPDPTRSVEGRGGGGQRLDRGRACFGGGCGAAVGRFGSGADVGTKDGRTKQSSARRSLKKIAAQPVLGNGEESV
jgi:hypothetical protein